MTFQFFVSRKLIDGSDELCFCCADSASMEVIHLPCCKAKKMGLSKQRMEECNALFFYQFLLPIVDPAMSGINGGTRIGYYEEVARNTNLYAFDQRTGEEHVVMSFVQPLLRSYLSGMALCAEI